MNNLDLKQADRWRT